MLLFDQNMLYVNYMLYVDSFTIKLPYLGS